MGEVVSLVDYRPPARYDETPWTEARVEESDTEVGGYALLETFALDPVDADPSRPASRSFTTTLGTASGLWYRVLVADADGDVSQPSTPGQNVLGVVFVDVEPYATVDELFRILKIRNPTAEQMAAGERVLVAAAGEINHELDRATDLAGWQLQLAAEVNLERAAELWTAEESPYGFLGFGETLAVPTGRDTWTRHAITLRPLKERWGIA